MTLPAGVTKADVKRAAEEFAAATNFSWSEAKTRRDFTRAMERALTAALAGRVVVPREPEQHQVLAAADSEGSFDTGEGAFGPNGYYAHIYRAMIAAAVDGA